MREPKPMRPLWPPLVKRVKRPRRDDTENDRRPARIPLTHHEILAFAEPIVRRARAVDLAGSDRLARRIHFKPTRHPDGADPAASIREHLVLEQPSTRVFRLTRTLTDAAGRTATLRCDGPDPGVLIERIDAIAPPRQFPTLGGLRVACDHRIETDRPAGADTPTRTRLVLLSATTKLDGIGIQLDARVGQGMPAEIRLLTPPERPIQPPDDLLAILGPAWRRLRPLADGGAPGWRAALRIPSQEPARTAALEDALARTLVHLVATLGAPPERFHARWAAARRRVWIEHALGALALVGLLLLGPATLLLGAPAGSPLRLLSFGLPALVLLYILSRHETPTPRLPARPRPLAPDAWPTHAVEDDRRTGSPRETF